MWMVKPRRHLFNHPHHSSIPLSIIDSTAILFLFPVHSPICPSIQLSFKPVGIAWLLPNTGVSEENRIWPLHSRRAALQGEVSDQVRSQVCALSSAGVHAQCWGIPLAGVCRSLPGGARKGP